MALKKFSMALEKILNGIEKILNLIENLNGIGKIKTGFCQTFFKKVSLEKILEFLVFCRTFF